MPFGFADYQMVLVQYQVAALRVLVSEHCTVSLALSLFLKTTGR